MFIETIRYNCYTILQGADIRFKWDQQKNRQLIKERSLDFQYAKELFGSSYNLSQKSDDPEQWRAIGWVSGRLITLIYEEREDNEGLFYWLVTGWLATETEEKLFNET